MNDIHGSEQKGRLPGPLSWFILAAWFASILFVSDQGYLHPADGPPIALLVAVIGPQIAFWVSYLFLREFRNYIYSLDILFLISVQCWRVVGLILVFLWAYGMLPGGFALPGGFGDIFVGVMALFVTLQAVRGSKGWRRNVVLLSVLGIADFTFALWAANFGGPASIDPPPADAIMTAGILTRLPLSLVPGFLVPAFACAHYAALLKVFKK